MSEGSRVQFRMPKARYEKLCGLAREAGVTPHKMAKAIFEDALEEKPIDPAALSEDLVIIRAGIEAMFRRAGKIDELDEAVSSVIARREARAATLTEGGRP